MRKRIDHLCSVVPEKSQPSGPPFSWKLGKPRFPLERWALGLGFFCPHWTPMMDSIYPVCKKLHPSRSPFVVTQLASWCKTVILGTDFSIQSSHSWWIIIASYFILFYIFILLLLFFFFLGGGGVPILRKPIATCEFSGNGCFCV